LKPIRPTDRIVLACSGDLVTSIAIPWLAERYGAEIVTVTLDLGQGGALADVRERALAAGAVRAHVIDARDEFAREFILPALHAGALDGEGDRLAIPLARLLVAQHLVAAAALENAAAVAHGIDVAAAGKSFAEAIRSLNPRLRVLSPAREWRLTRAAQIDYARASDIPVLEPVDRAAAISSNLWGRSIRPAAGTQASLSLGSHLIRSAAAAPDLGASVAIRFDRGLPVAINDVDMPLVDLIGSLTTIAGAHGVGRLTGGAACSGDGVAIEAPAAAVLRAALRDLRTAVLPAKALRVLPGLAASCTELIVRGRWFTPSRESLNGLLAATREHLTGTIRLELSKGACGVVDRDVPDRPGDDAAMDEFIPEPAHQRIAPAQA
jgi:argininosuccinate synthase